MKPAHPMPHPLATWLPLALCVLIIIGAIMPRKQQTELDLRGLGQLPVLMNGRIKPVDTVARTSLLVLQDKQSLKLPDKTKLAAMPWLAEVVFEPEKADDRPVFLIHDPDVLGVIGRMQGEVKRFSFNELADHMEEISRLATKAFEVEAPNRTLFQKDIIALREHVGVYHQLRNSFQAQGVQDLAGDLARLAPMRQSGLAASQQLVPGGMGTVSQESLQFLQEAHAYTFQAENALFFAVPPLLTTDPQEEWKKVGESALTLDPRLATDRFHPAVYAYGEMATAYRLKDAARFNTALGEYQQWLEATHPKLMKKSLAETFFNAFAPFYQSMVLYTLAGVLALVSWLAWPVNMARAGYVVLLIAVAVHTLGLAFRMMLEGRPPVTNLYSSAIFIGWGAVLLGVLLERLYRQGIGTVTAASIGFVTLLIAHHLSLSGDTLEMMRAVLDSNFWLATHVIIITLGYSATFLAGFLGIIYVCRGVFTRGLTKELASALSRMVYGIVCFAALFSLVGTILGGIWADQSWGRFWGWDPKENGALLIVIWNAVILHARWGGIARERGIMQMAVFGNIVTSWSWFGTNMLGVGLHSYGFMDAAFYYLIAFVASQLLIISLAWLPLRIWRSFSAKCPAEAKGNPATMADAPPVAAEV